MSTAPESPSVDAVVPAVDQVAPAVADDEHPPSRAPSEPAETPTTPTNTTPASSLLAPAVNLKDERLRERLAQEEHAAAVQALLKVLEDDVWALPKEQQDPAARAWVKKLWGILDHKVRRRAIARGQR